MYSTPLHLFFFFVLFVYLSNFQRKKQQLISCFKNGIFSFLRPGLQSAPQEFSSLPCPGCCAQPGVLCDVMLLLPGLASCWSHQLQIWNSGDQARGDVRTSINLIPTSLHVLRPPILGTLEFE